MRVAIVTPARVGARNGNRVTAIRIARLLRQSGHRVDVSVALPPRRADLLIAIHAWRSADAVRAFQKRYPGAPVVVLLAGTDIYRFQFSHARETLATMRAADALVALHDFAGNDIPQDCASRLTIIKQSCALQAGNVPRASRWFEACVLAHLRDEKDSLRAALAARHVPSHSRLRVVHLGGSHTPQWLQDAEQEQASNPRFVSRGEVQRAAALRALRRAHVMVISSTAEGGANVVTEAMALGTPVLASDISGNRGLLGDAHPGYFPVRDETALAKLLWRMESDASFYDEVKASTIARADELRPEVEREAWERLLNALVS